MAADDDDKRFDPTPKRRAEFRKQGRIARARDASAVVVLATVLAVLVGTREEIARVTEQLFTVYLGDVGALVRGENASIRTAALQALVVLVVPVMVASLVASVTVGLAQTGIEFNTDLIGFKPERLDPTSRLQQMFSLGHGGFEVFMSLSKVAVVGWAIYGSVEDSLPVLLQLTGVDARASLLQILDALSGVILRAIAAMGVMAAADYAYSWYRLERDMKMSLTELKEEMKQDDGDPHIKAKRRAKQRQMARKRMMEGVARAAVVVTNPTHIAVALRYEDTDAAPVVVAKGHDDLALAIRREARSHGIPILENRPLARTLDADVEVGHPIRVEHFGAVAKVLAIVFKIRGRKQSAPRRKPGQRAGRSVRGTRRA
jgi:flagellar biosynthetic protein FlhB